MHDKSPHMNPFTHLVLTALLLTPLPALYAVDVANLRCESLTNPLGIDERQPRLSWMITSDERDQRQTAYQIVVVAGNETLWDTSRIVSNETSGIVYAGKQMASEMRCSWKVKVWDKDGKESVWSQPASWTMGLLEASDWKAEWIGYDKARNATQPIGAHASQPKSRNEKKQKSNNSRLLPPPAYLRTEFKAAKPITRATLYATGLGIFDIHLNDRLVAKDWFNQGWTDYAKRAYYRTYDVTSLLKPGDNRFEAVVADGWYSGYVGMGNHRDHYGKYEAGSGVYSFKSDIHETGK